jgi:hypothetical protein
VLKVVKVLKEPLVLKGRKVQLRPQVLKVFREDKVLKVVFKGLKEVKEDLVLQVLFLVLKVLKGLGDKVSKGLQDRLLQVLKELKVRQMV